jgi:hypothetical protein
MIATTNLIGATAKRTIEAQEKQASVVLLGDLEAAEVDWPASAGAGMPRSPQRFCVPGGWSRTPPKFTAFLYRLLYAVAGLAGH